MKRMQGLPYEAVEAIAEVLVRSWTNGTNLRLDVSFVEVRAAKARLKRDEAYRALVMRQLTESPAFTRSDNVHLLRALESKFHGIVKALARIGAEIADWQEFGDLFVNLQERFVDVLRDTGMDQAQLATYFDALISCSNPYIICPKRPLATESWRRFLAGTRDCALLLFDTIPPP